MILPPTILHFQVNFGNNPALAYASLTSARPNFQTTTNSIFPNYSQTEIVKKITLLNDG